MYDYPEIEIFSAMPSKLKLRNDECVDHGTTTNFLP